MIIPLCNNFWGSKNLSLTFYTFFREILISKLSLLYISAQSLSRKFENPNSYSDMGFYPLQKAAPALSVHVSNDTIFIVYLEFEYITYKSARWMTKI